MSRETAELSREAFDEMFGRGLGDPDCLGYPGDDVVEEVVNYVYVTRNPQPF